jgi:ABC-type branched-subunit amino acid transport system permease subunit
LLGALVTIPLLEISNAYLARVGHGGAHWFLYGLLIVVIVLFRPNGIVSFYGSAKAYFAKRRMNAVKKESNGS